MENASLAPHIGTHFMNWSVFRHDRMSFSVNVASLVSTSVRTMRRSLWQMA